MATYSWVGLNASWTSNLFWTMGGVSDGTVPGANDTAVVAAPGAYTLSVKSAVTVGTLLLSDAAATLRVQGTLTISNGTWTNAGTAALSPGGQLVYNGTALANTGTISLGSGSQLVLAGTASTVGLGLVVSAGGTLVLEGSLDNTAATLSSATLQNLLVANAVVTGGTLVNDGGTLSFIGATFIGTTLLGDFNFGAQNVALKGTASFAPRLPGGTSTVDVANGLSDANPALMSALLLRLGAGARVSLAGTLDSTGVIAVSGGQTGSTLTLPANLGTITTANTLDLTLALNQGALAVTAGTLRIDAALDNEGIITAAGGNVLAGAALTGSGGFLLSGGATVELAKTYGAQSFRFLDTTDTLRFDFPAGAVTSTVLGFSGGDTIELAGNPATNVTFSNGTLTASNGTLTLANFALPDAPAGTAPHVFVDASDNTFISTDAIVTRGATTVLAAGGTVVTIPFYNPLVGAAAQPALDPISALVQRGFLTQQFWPGGNGAAALVIPFGGEIVAVRANNNLGILPGNYESMVDTSPSVCAVIGGANTTVVAAGAGTQLVYQNQSPNAQIFLGGISYIRNLFGISSATIDVDGGTVPGGGAAIVDNATGGAVTVNAFANALVDLIPGGTLLLNAGAGTVIAEVNGGSTIAATIAGVGGAGSQIDFIPNGGNAFINPGAENVVVLDNGAGAGSDTLRAGTGAATVFGGEGMFTGGGAGSNVLLSGTLPGGATLVGGAAGDLLQSFGVGNRMVAGPGAETLIGATGLTPPGASVAAPAGGQTFVLGAGPDAVFGDQSGGDTILTGSGNATIRLGHGTSTQLGNILREVGAGGSATIFGFATAPFLAHDAFVLAAGVTATVATVFIAPGNVTSTARLSDGSSIVFLNAFQAITVNAGTLY